MYCYRHPDREAYVRCQRCDRFICPACQHEAAVGFLCPEDAGPGSRPVGGARGRFTRAMESLGFEKDHEPKTRRQRQIAPLTMLLVIINVVLWAAELLIPNDEVLINLAYSPLMTAIEPWRMITAGFVHSPSNFFHIALNMYSLWIFGRELEPVLGKGRYLALYLLAVFGGSLGVLWLGDVNSWTVGASGAIFGLMAAYFVVLRSIGGNTQQMLTLIAINLSFGFFVSGVSWQAHVGGLLVGGLVAYVYSRTRGANKGALRNFGVGSIAVALVVLTVIGVLVKLPVGAY